MLARTIFSVVVLVAAHSVAPQPAVAQVSGCSTQSGEVGDWRWVASWAGPELSPLKLTIVTDGDIKGGPVQMYGKPGRWILSLKVVRSFTKVSLLAANGVASMRWTLTAKLMPPSAASPNHYWWLPDLAPIFDSKAGLGYGSQPMTLELREGDRLIAKLAVGLQGFGEVLAKAQAANKPIADAYNAKRCVPGGDPNDEP